MILFAARQQLEGQYAASLGHLAVLCDQQGLAAVARRTRDWLPADRDQRLLLFDPTQPRTPASEESKELAAWRSRFTELRAKQADELFALARQAAAVGGSRRPS